MIKYSTDVYGLHQLLAWHGSAAWRAFVPACFSTAMLIAFGAWRGDVDEAGPGLDRRWLVHPYAMTVFIAFFTFLLVFRLNYSYQRYWEACGEVHKMISKWLDSAITAAAFHYQCHQYDDVRPPTFGKNPNLTNETRERERLKYQTQQEVEEFVKEQAVRESKERGTILRRMFGGGRSKAKSATQPVQRHPTYKTFKPTRTQEEQTKNHFSHPDSKRRTERRDDDSRDANRRNVFASGRSTQRASIQLHVGADAIPVPSLFLQEAAHLYSLLSAVAMSTLRNDVEGVQSPLAEYVLGQPFPPVNPDDLGPDIREQYLEESKFWSFIYFILGMARSPRHRTMYNAARPFTVLGGISDHETRLLQAARGPHAQMALVTMWLKEFISREYLNGSTGAIHPPIIGRLYQYISDGVVGYNQCRKIAFVPFPFPHAQITVFFVSIILFACPVIYWNFVRDIYLACVMNFVTVLCFCGSHEVARELENPYSNAPNDIPLNHFQAQFNESLLSMYAGFHPDSWQERREMSSPTAAAGVDSIDASMITTKQPVGSEEGETSEEEMHVPTPATKAVVP